MTLEAASTALYFYWTLATKKMEEKQVEETICLLRYAHSLDINYNLTPVDVLNTRMARGGPNGVLPAGGSGCRRVAH